jgi:hypothetical protein
MYGLCPCNKYIKGLDAFINFVKKGMLNIVRVNLCCPYKYCKNENKYRSDDMLMSHFINVGINIGRKDLMKQR